jgi:hypothetical protein
MPIVEVEIVLRAGEVLRTGLAAELADRAAAVFDAPTGTTWAKLRSLPAEQYAENDFSRPTEVYPVFVTVLKARLPNPAGLQREAAQLAEAFAQPCDRSIENVHIVYLPAGAGRVAFGGRLLPG